MSTILAGTGHRPDKLGGYGPQAYDRLVYLATDILSELRPDYVISGMALGWDQALAQACVILGIPWTAAVPFGGQELAWPEASQREYRRLLDKASARVTVCPGGYSASKMQQRNQWMVDHATAVLALWDGSPGGTGNCVRYAEQRGVPIHNFWGRFAELDREK